jgi:anti-sigma regulatory factor (Ser/Thr protein kinase)
MLEMRRPKTRGTETIAERDVWIGPNRRTDLTDRKIDKVRRGPTGWEPGRIRISLPSTPASVAAARRAVEALLAGESRSELSSKLKLVVSELMTNAVTYGMTGEEINLGLTLYVEHAHVSIHHCGPPLDMTQFRRRRRDGGRGLDIVAGLVEGWGIETGPMGTTITARVRRTS